MAFIATVSNLPITRKSAAAHRTPPAVDPSDTVDPLPAVPATPWTHRCWPRRTYNPVGIDILARKSGARIPGSRTRPMALRNTCNVDRTNRHMMGYQRSRARSGEPPEYGGGSNPNTASGRVGGNNE
jgi:hypothetical protein